MRTERFRESGAAQYKNFPSHSEQSRMSVASARLPPAPADSGITSCLPHGTRSGLCKALFQSERAASRVGHENLTAQEVERLHGIAQRELVNDRLVSKILGTSGRPDHGSVVGFQEYSCRCEPCTQAHTRDWLERDPRGAAAARQAARQAEPQDDPVPR